jgi:acetyl/propionyl-CoA carboxylase alpha subunit
MRYSYEAGSATHEVVLERHGEGYQATIDGQVYEIEVLNAESGALGLRVSQPNGPEQLRLVYWAAEGDVKWLSSQGCTYRLERPRPRRARGAQGTAPEDSLRAPMPARVRSVQVAEGESVEAGQTLMLLEAMKMEIRLQAPHAGRVARLLVATDDTVERDQVLVELEGEQ